MMKKKQIGTLVLAIIVITSLIQCKSTQEKELSPQLDSYFKQQVFNQSDALNEENNPGFSVIITKKDSVLYVGSHGSSNLDKASPITENTIFDIASVTKQLTGMAIALLEERGKIDLNDKIIKYLPDLPGVMNDISVYQLVHHTSGIRDWPALFALKGWRSEEPLSMDDIYEILKKQESLNFTPGTEFSYSNSNYNLLAKIVEVVTDTEFNSWTHDNIFIPLGMENTYYLENNNSEEVIADSYVYTGHDYLPFSNKLSAPGSSSLRSSALDMSKWLINFHSKTLGGNSAINRITHKGNLNSSKTIDYGYGLNITKIKNKKAYAHDGAWGGYRSGTVYFPEESIGIVILSNNGILQPKKMIGDIVDIIFRKKEDNRSNGSDLIEKEINDDFFSLCAGKYEQVDDKGCYLTFFKEGEEYFANAYGKKFKLYAKSDSVFFPEGSNAELVFHLKNGKVNSHTLKKNGNSYLALKVKESKNEIKINYDQLIGDYYSKELNIKYEVKSENGELAIISPIFPQDIILEHSEDLTFMSNSGLIQSISFLEKDDSIINLIINNPRSRNILFERLN